MTWQPTGRDAAGRWVKKRYKKQRFRSAVVPCRTNHDVERNAWEDFVAFRSAVDAEIAAAGEDGPPDGYRLTIALQNGIAERCETELRLLKRTAKIPLLEQVGPDGEERTPEDRREYLGQRRRLAVEVVTELRRKARSRYPSALSATVAFPFMSVMSVELPADWDEQVAAGLLPPPPRADDAGGARRWMDRRPAAAAFVAVSPRPERPGAGRRGAGGDLHEPVGPAEGDGVRGPATAENLRPRRLPIAE